MATTEHQAWATPPQEPEDPSGQGDSGRRKPAQTHDGQDEKKARKEDARIAAERPSKEPCSHEKTDGSSTVVDEASPDYTVRRKITVMIRRVTGLMLAVTALVGAVSKLVEEASKHF